MSLDWSAFVGLPWRDRGRGPDGYDCWGLCRAAFTAATAIELPSYAEGYRSAADAAATARVLAREVADWIDVATAGVAPLDAAVMTIAGRFHIGLVVRPGSVLHMPFQGTSVIAPLSLLPKPTIYRHRLLSALSDRSQAPDRPTARLM